MLLSLPARLFATEGDLAHCRSEGPVIAAEPRLQVPQSGRRDLVEGRWRSPGPDWMPIVRSRPAEAIFANCPTMPFRCRAGAAPDDAGGTRGR